jgi:hypothetical protein
MKTTFAAVLATTVVLGGCAHTWTLAVNPRDAGAMYAGTMDGHGTGVTTPRWLLAHLCIY